MKKILIIILGLIGFAQAQVNVAGYIQTNGVASYPTHIDSMGKGGYVVVYDTTQRNSITCLRRKFGMAVYTQKDTTLWILRDSSCNNNWIAFTSGISSVDSLVYATKANVIKVRDSLLAADNFLSGVNTFLNTLNVSNDLQLGAANASYGNAIFYNANNSNKVQIFSSDTLATDVDIELPTSSGKLALTTDTAIVDTSIISTKAYVNYKDDIQQGFIDMRKLDADSSAWTGYATRARLQQQMDSASAAQAVINGVQNDTLNNHNTRILANENANNLKLNISDTSVFARKAILINNQVASYTLVLADAGARVRINSASATTLTVPPNSSVAFPIGTQIIIKRVGSGDYVTITAGSGVTFSNADSALRLRVAGSSCVLTKTGTDTWDLEGDLI